jgi:hypothetical protein
VSGPGAWSLPLPGDARQPQEEPPPSDAERLRAVQILLADPESLGDDVFESCLYILRDRLTGRDQEAG